MKKLNRRKICGRCKKIYKAGHNCKLQELTGDEVIYDPRDPINYYGKVIETLSKGGHVENHLENSADDTEQADG